MRTKCCMKTYMHYAHCKVSMNIAFLNKCVKENAQKSVHRYSMCLFSRQQPENMSYKNKNNFKRNLLNLDRHTLDNRHA